MFFFSKSSFYRYFGGGGVLTVKVHGKVGVLTDIFSNNQHIAAK